MQHGPQRPLAHRSRDHALLVPRGANPSQRHGKAAFRVAATPRIGHAEDGVNLLARHVADPAHVSGIAVAGHPGHHLADVSHGPAREAEVRYADDALVAQFKGGEVAFAAPDLRAQFTAAHHRRGPGVPGGLVEEGLDRPRPGLGIADRITAGQHDPGHDPVADTRLAGRGPDDALVVAEREIAERVPVPVLTQQLPDLVGIPGGQPGLRLRGPQEQIGRDDQGEQPQGTGQQVVAVAPGIGDEADWPGDPDDLEHDIFEPDGK